MTGYDLGRRIPTALHVLAGALLAGTGLYLVPALALDGQTLHAAVAALVCAGIVALWLLARRALGQAAGRVGSERATHQLYRSLLDHGSEGHIVVRPDGAISFASGNIRSILGVDPERLEGRGGLLAMVREHDRRRALHAFARARRQPGRTLSLEIGGWHTEGRDFFLDVRMENLTGSAAVSGILMTIRDITSRKTVESEIQHLAYYDALTGLPNRRFFLEQGSRSLALSRRRRERAAVVSLDVDRFTETNGPGQARGVELLERVAEALQASVRETDLAARLGADDFVALLTDIRDEEEARRVGHRILESMPATLETASGDRPVGVTVGVAIFPGDGEDLETLLRASDIALSRAKATGTAMEFYRPELRPALADQLRLEQELKGGLERHEFHLHYQPIFQLMTGQKVGAEALSRWRHFTRGIVAASEFIQLAERSGLIRSLDRWAIARAVHERGTYLDDGWLGWVAVNLSPQSLSDPGLADYVRSVLESARVAPGSLVLEMPAGAVLQDPDAVADLMWELKNAGAAIALDDFGVGSTSFSRLKRLPIDILKLHPEFIAGIGLQASDEHLVEASISIAHGIRARVLAKGVEQDRQLEWLRDAGCDFVQGFLTGPPVPASELAVELGTDPGGDP